MILKLNHFFLCQESTQSILAEINDSFLNDRPYFFKYELQAYGKVTCAYTANQLIYAFHNQMETLILRFDNQYNLSQFQPIYKIFVWHFVFFRWYRSTATVGLSQKTNDRLVQFSLECEVRPWLTNNKYEQILFYVQQIDPLESN